MKEAVRDEQRKRRPKSKKRKSACYHIYIYTVYLFNIYIYIYIYIWGLISKPMHLYIYIYICSPPPRNPPFCVAYIAKCENVSEICIGWQKSDVWMWRGANFWTCFRHSKMMIMKWCWKFFQEMHEKVRAKLFWKRERDQKGWILSKRRVWEEFMPLKKNSIKKELFEERKFFKKRTWRKRENLIAKNRFL